MEKIIPLVVKFCNIDDDELREYCIQAFESFVRRFVFARHLHRWTNRTFISKFIKKVKKTYSGKIWLLEFNPILPWRMMS